MSEHTPHTIERHCDVAIVGGSAAGLAAALQLGRQRRSVIVIDAGEPRNAPAANMHSYLGHEGIAPSDFNMIASEEVRSYGVEVLDGRAIEITRTEDSRFRVELVGGHIVIAPRVLAATGLLDELPDIEGLAEHWGDGVIHCPFCHGYEVRDDRIVQIITNPMGLHTAGLFHQLSERLTLVLHSGVHPEHPEIEALSAAGVRVIDERVRRVVSGGNGRVASVELSGGERVDADSVAIGVRFRPRVDAFASLGATPVGHPTGLGDVLETDTTGETTIAGLYAAGNVTDPSQQVLQAAADGSRVGAMISSSLASSDIAAVSRTAASQVEWDHRYSGAQMWSGNPNGTLVHEITGLDPGRALDVGAGEGADAIWLAQHGWQVTATDISLRAVDQVAAIADHRDLSIISVQADANSRRPFSSEGFDLVTAHYASIHRTSDKRGINNILAAVAPGGTLLIVGHDPEQMRHPIDTTQRSRAFDPDAYIRIDDFIAVLTDSTDWHIDVHEKRPRPPGHAAASHHVDDIVLRARRNS